MANYDSLRRGEYRVLFQNSEGNINMGVWFNDPDLETDDLIWYNILASEIYKNKIESKECFSTDEKFGTGSCYAELHRYSILCLTIVANKFFIVSHPVGLNGQNFIVIPTPIKYLSMIEFDKRQKSMNPNSSPALMKSMSAIKSKIIENKNQAKKFKEKGNIAFNKKRYNDAEKYYSKAIQLNTGLRLLWTNRAACRNTMKKHNEALSDCDTALVINPNCTRTIIEKGNALLALSRFDEAKDWYESLRALGEATSADHHLGKLENVQERFQSLKVSYFYLYSIYNWSFEIQ